MHLQATIGFFTLISYTYVSPETVNHYEEYLGTVEEQRQCQQEGTIDPRVPKRGQGNPSAVVCNHTGWLEIYALIASPIHPGFTPRIEMKTMAGINKLTEGL